MVNLIYGAQSPRALLSPLLPPLPPLPQQDSLALGTVGTHHPTRGQDSQGQGRVPPGTQGDQRAQMGFRPAAPPAASAPSASHQSPPKGAA